MVNFDSIIPGMAAGRYDMTVSSMTPTDKRIAVIDFIDYLQVGNAIVVAKGAHAPDPGHLVRQASWCADRLLPADHQHP